MTLANRSLVREPYRRINCNTFECEEIEEAANLYGLEPAVFIRESALAMARLGKEMQLKRIQLQAVEMRLTNFIRGIRAQERAK